MTVYLDASVVVSMFLADANTPRALDFAERYSLVTLSLWTVAEFSSALAVQTRIGRAAPMERRRAEARFDEWLTLQSEPLVPTPDDFAAARRMLRVDSAVLRTPDALHLAICERVGTALATFDVRMRQAAQAFGVPTIEV